MEFHLLRQKESYVILFELVVAAAMGFIYLFSD